MDCASVQHPSVRSCVPIPNQPSHLPVHPPTTAQLTIMFALTWAAAFLAASAQVMAFPIVSRCDEPQTCNATLPYNFTLAAYNPAQPDADPAPLYLTWGQPSHSSAGSYWVLAVSAAERC